MLDTVNCRALSREIEFGYCMEFEMAADDMINWDGMEDVFTPEQVAVCKNCPARANPLA